MRFRLKSNKDDITSLEEAIEIMGEENVITPMQLKEIGLTTDIYPLKIPRKLLKWDIVSNREERELLAFSDVEKTILTYDVKEIFFPHDQRLDRRCLIFTSKKYFDIFKTSYSDKINLWRKMKYDRKRELSLKGVKVDDKVYVVYDKRTINRCPYILFPGVALNVLEMSKKFPGFVCFKISSLDCKSRADSEDCSKGKFKALNRKVKHGWYLFLKHPEKDRFIMKGREQQSKELKSFEKFSPTAEALQAGLFAKVILDINILTDYTHCNDWMYQNEGKWTTVIRNFTCTDDYDAKHYVGNFEISSNISFHGHRNTVIAVIIPVSSDRNDAEIYAQNYKKMISM